MVKKRWYVRPLKIVLAIVASPLAMVYDIGAVMNEPPTYVGDPMQLMLSRIWQWTLKG